MLAQAVAAELVPRGVKAVEAFGSTGPASQGCLMPADYLRSVGFKTVRPHPSLPAAADGAAIDRVLAL